MASLSYQLSCHSFKSFLDICKLRIQLENKFFWRTFEKKKRKTKRYKREHSRKH